LLANRKLTGEGSRQDTRHYEICLKGSGLTYEVGDALGIVPRNSPELVEEILNSLDFDGEEEVSDPEGDKMPIRPALASLRPSLFRCCKSCSRASDRRGLARKNHAL
jgi:sulfite reductase (NADPH) flavoprotein alpha-component